MYRQRERGREREESVPRADSGLYCGESVKEGGDRQPRAIDGVQTGSTAPDGLF